MKLEILYQICRFAREVRNKKSDHVSKNLTAIHTLQEINQPSFPRAPRQNPSNRLMLRAHWPPWRPKSFVVASTCLRALEILDRSKRKRAYDNATYIILMFSPISPSRHWVGILQTLHSFILESSPAVVSGPWGSPGSVFPPSNPSVQTGYLF